MRKFEFDLINPKTFARFLVDYEFNFEIDFTKRRVIVHLDDSIDAINQFYTFMIDHYDPQITLSDILDSEIFPVKL
ncbi:hypothetical protein EVB55_065 [Rhizobium phage RHph_Y68]|uniref:Uncharacterized protein n=1 Tax=Rhizobium phage RHph_Y68 TaxID=2509787 RepID=A0A7S5QY75_9CAUD|nr:hypothetical protein PP934_gp065 [Rhizobium phage RHph_Y68]QIG68000.1 hypothetical protein EVB55_065 [Rhizobium phage RHph_Y68]